MHSEKMMTVYSSKKERRKKKNREHRGGEGGRGKERGGEDRKKNDFETNNLSIMIPGKRGELGGGSLSTLSLPSALRSGRSMTKGYVT